MNIFLAVIILCLSFFSDEKASISGKANKPVEETAIQWMTIEQAEEACAKKPRKIFVDVYTGWCGWCKKMDASTFKNPAVVKYVNEKFYAVKLDAEYKNNIIFRGKLFKYNASRETNDLASTLLNGQMNYPTLVYLDEKLNVIQTMEGYVDGKQFDLILHYFGQEAYKKKVSLEDFKAQYKPQ
jgi:thioredoxin-related protein